MTSEEIKKSPYNLDKWGGYANLAMWLKEIAYQLAVMNEREHHPRLPEDVYNALVRDAMSWRSK